MAAVVSLWHWLLCKFDLHNWQDLGWSVPQKQHWETLRQCSRCNHGEQWTGGMYPRLLTPDEIKAYEKRRHNHLMEAGSLIGWWE